MAIPQKRAVVHRNGHNVGWFYDECWRCTVHILWPVTPEQLEDYLRKAFDIEIPCRRFDGRAVEVGEAAPGVHVIALREWEMTPRWSGVLAHECLHVTEQVLIDRGMRHGWKTSEAFAYLLESLMCRSMEILNQEPRALRVKKTTTKGTIV